MTCYIDTFAEQAIQITLKIESRSLASLAWLFMKHDFARVLSETNYTNTGNKKRYRIQCWHAETSARIFCAGLPSTENVFCVINLRDAEILFQSIEKTTNNDAPT